MTYKSYENYKDSGIEWIDEIPEHWEIRKMKNLIFFQEGPGLRNWQFADSGIRVICVTNITEKGIDFSNYEKFISEEEYKQMYQHFTVNSGDLLLSSSGNSWGKVAEYLDDETVILNTSTIRINENKDFGSILTQSFIKWSLQSEAVREQLGLMMTGSCQPNFGPTHLAKVLVPFPTSLKEQRLIADYLDKKISRIDENITKNKKLISLLEEKKTALINQAVTKGLNPNVPMKDSGIEWIGEIPEHWNIRKNKFLLEKITDGSHTSVEIIDDGYPYVTVTDLDEERESVDVENSKKISKKDYNLLLRNGCKPSIGDILFSQIGTVGLVVPVDERDDYVLLSSIAILTPSNNINRRWLIYFLKSINIKYQWKNYMAGGAVKRITLNHISNFQIAIPPLSEQNEISKFLDKKIKKINKTIYKIKRNIDLLEEYRVSLIHHTVTGKIDVRDEI